MPRSLVVLVFLVDCILCIMSQGSPRMWEEMSDLEKMNRLKDLQRRIFFDIKNQGGGGSGYGAPNDGYGVPAAPPSYNAPAPKPSYNAPAPKPSYNAPAPKPSYNARPSYGGGNKGKKVLEIPVPNLPIPDPIDFKAGVLRSKGRIASGLFHAKAGLLRAGANLLAQKANSLDKFAQAIPGLNAKVIQKLQGLKKGGGGGGGYGAPPSPGYGGPQPPPSNTYGTPPKQNPGYNGGGGGGGNFNTASAPNLGNTFNSGSSISAGNSYSSGGSSGNFNSGGSNFNSGGSSFNSNSGGSSFTSNSGSSSFNSGSGLSSVGLTASNSYNSGGNNFNSGGGNSFNSGSNSNFNSGAQQVQTNFKPSNGDSYGNPVGNVITSNSNSNNNFNGNSASIPVGSSLSFGGNNNQPNYNGGNNNFNGGNSNSGFSGGNSNSGFSNSNSDFSNSNNGFSGSNSLDSYGGGGNSGNNQGSVLAGVNPRANPATSSVDQGLLVLENGNDFTPLIESTLEQLMHGGGVTSNSVRNIRNEAERLLLQESRDLSVDPATCKAESRSLANLLEDIFMGNEVIPDVIDEPPLYPLDLTYKTIRTFPGMRLTADMTRFKPMLKWPAQPDSLYTVVISNLDINSRKNRTLSEFWHWFVANIPGDSVDDGEVVFDLLFPLVLPEGDGDHRYGYFVFEQPRQLDYGDEGGPTDACSPQMSNGRGPFKSTKNFMRKYNLKLTAATFIILDSNEASMEIACEWQKCIGNTINLVSPLQCSKK